MEDNLLLRILKLYWIDNSNKLALFRQSPNDRNNSNAGGMPRPPPPPLSSFSGSGSGRSVTTFTLTNRSSRTASAQTRPNNMSVPTLSNLSTSTSSRSSDTQEFSFSDMQAIDHAGLLDESLRRIMEGRLENGGHLLQWFDDESPPKTAYSLFLLLHGDGTGHRDNRLNASKVSRVSVIPYLDYLSSAFPVSLPSSIDSEVDEEVLRTNKRVAVHVDFLRGLILGSGLGTVTNAEKAFEHTFRAAQADHPLAANEIAFRLMEGQGTSVDTAQSMHWHRRAAELGNMFAENVLGNYYRNGENGVTRNLSQAISHYRRAAERGHGYAQLNLSDCLREVDAAQSVHWLERAVAQNLADAQWALSATLEKGVPGYQSANPARALMLCRMAAEQHQRDACLRLALHYESGDQLNKDRDQEIHWLQIAADKGLVSAMHKLGMYLLRGDDDGENRDKEMAAQWFARGAEKGNAECQLALAQCCLDGEGMPQDKDAGIQWLIMSVTQGCAEAELLLGACYLDGRGLPRNVALGVEQVQSSADHGCLDAWAALGLLYQQGDQVELDWRRCVHYFAHAAALRHPSSLYHLGRMHENAIGVPRSMRRALLFLGQAARCQSRENDLDECIGKCAKAVLEEAVGERWSAHELLRPYTCAATGLVTFEPAAVESEQIDGSLLRRVYHRDALAEVYRGTNDGVLRDPDTRGVVRKISLARGRVAICEDTRQSLLRTVLALSRSEAEASDDALALAAELEQQTAALAAQPHRPQERSDRRAALGRLANRGSLSDSDGGSIPSDDDDEVAALRRIRRGDSRGADDLIARLHELRMQLQSTNETRQRLEDEQRRESARQDEVAHFSTIGKHNYSRDDYSLADDGGGSKVTVPVVL